MFHIAAPAGEVLVAAEYTYSRLTGSFSTLAREGKGASIGATPRIKLRCDRAVSHAMEPPTCRP